MQKQILFGAEARAKLQRGVDILAKAVRQTLGPKGKVAVFQRNKPIFSLDGVTVAKEIILEDPIEKMGADLIKNVAEETDREAGDGTTTATILCQELIREGVKAIGAGLDVIEIRTGLQKGLTEIKETIKKFAKPIKKTNDIADVATISSRDPEIGLIIADVIGKLGKDAIITVEETKTIGMEREIVEGLKFDNGFLSPYFMTSKERGIATMEKPYILITNQNLRTNSEIVPILEKIAQTNTKSVVIIANDIGGEALPTLVINKLQGRLNILAVKAPGLGDDKDGQLEDIAIASGGLFLSEEIGKKAEDADIEDFGRAESVMSTQSETIIVGGHGNKAKMKEQIKKLERLRDEETLDYQKEKINKRIGRLKGKVAIIKVGTISHEENQEKRYRVEDAVRSALSAIEEGIVPGAGMALIKCSERLKRVIEKEHSLGVRAGMQILANAIREPARQIILNSGENADVILNTVSREPEGSGYNPNTKQIVNLIEAGIIDPAKVVRVAAENAVSRVSLFLITETVIADEPQKKDEKKSE